MSFLLRSADSVATSGSVYNLTSISTIGKPAQSGKNVYKRRSTPTMSESRAWRGWGASGMRWMPAPFLHLPQSHSRDEQNEPLDGEEVAQCVGKVPQGDVSSAKVTSPPTPKSRCTTPPIRAKIPSSISAIEATAMPVGLPKFRLALGDLRLLVRVKALMKHDQLGKPQAIKRKRK